MFEIVENAGIALGIVVVKIIILAVVALAVDWVAFGKRKSHSPFQDKYRTAAVLIAIVVAGLFARSGNW